MAFFQRLVPERVEEKNVLNKVVEIEVGKIIPNPSQPRVIFNDYELSQLAISIQQNGILQPLTVRRNDDSNSERFELIAGERRLRAAKLAGMSCVPCIVMETTAEKSALFAIMENIQRSDLNYIEEAFAIYRLIEFLKITQEEAAMKLGIAQSTVANKLRLLRLSDEEKSAALRYGLNERQARALLKLPSEYRITAIEKISSSHLNTAAADRLIEETLKSIDRPAKKQVRKSFYVRQAALYINTFNHTIDSMKKSGVDCVVRKNKTDEFIEYNVKIPLK
ncbi:MAG: ParB/RepB/Spo0J family partition protein [Oscillospiraceae bacterium]|nr:ParB/RepB/Spo0J family partition protein [Oscillospiraceae bacterium]